MKKHFLLSFSICLYALNSNAQNTMNFDGGDDFAIYPAASTQLIGAEGISLTLWMHPTYDVPGFPDFGGVVGFRNEIDADFYILQLSSTSLEARFRGDNFQAYDIVYNGLNLLEWQHYALTYNGSDLILYRDGLEVGFNAAFGSINNGFSDLYIGKLPFSLENFNFQGDIDEVSMWTKALTPEEVLSIYNCGIVGTESGLEAYYKFDQGIASGDNTSIQFLDAEVGQDAAIMNMTLTGDTSNFVQGALTPNQETINTDLIVDANTLTAVEMADTYQWYSCGDDYEIIIGETTASFTAFESGNYAVFMELGGCSGFSDCENITVSNLPENDLNFLSIYPNPVNNSEGFQIRADKTWSEITIHDILGRQIVSSQTFEPSLYIPTSNWESGVYFATVYWTDDSKSLSRIMLRQAITKR